MTNSAHHPRSTTAMGIGTGTEAVLAVAKVVMVIVEGDEEGVAMEEGGVEVGVGVKGGIITRGAEPATLISDHACSRITSIRYLTRNKRKSDLPNFINATPSWLRTSTYFSSRHVVAVLVYRYHSF